MRLRLHPAPNYFVAAPGITIGCVEKLNTFKPEATLCCAAQTTTAELALFDTVIVQKYAPTHWSAWLSSTLSIGR
jgi:hypothetical protein